MRRQRAASPPAHRVVHSGPPAHATAESGALIVGCPDSPHDRGARPSVSPVLGKVQRERDPPFLLPLYAQPGHEKSGSRRVAQRNRRLGEAARWYNRCVRTLRQLFDGTSPSVEAASKLGLSFERSGVDPRACEGMWGGEAVLLREVHARFLQDRPESVPSTERAAFQRLIGEGNSYGPVPRGTIVPLVVEYMSLPSVRAIPIGNLSQRAGALLARWEDVMLGPRPSDRTVLDTKSYMDPAMQNAANRARLAARMWQGGLLRPVARQLTVRGIALFAGFKRIDSDGKPNLRLIFDMRQPNLYWRAPPGADLASVEAFGCLELDRELTE